MKIQWKRLLSALLVLVMVLSVLPAAAFADEGDTVNLTVTCWVHNSSSSAYEAKVLHATAKVSADGELRFSLPGVAEAVPYAELEQGTEAKDVTGTTISNLQGRMEGEEFVITNAALLTTDLNDQTLQLSLNYDEYTYTVSLDGEVKESNLWHTDNYSLPDVPEKRGEKAVGWAFGNNIYQAGTTVALDDLITQVAYGTTTLNFTPVYEELKDHLVLWVDSDSGLVYGHKTVYENETAANITDPTKDGYSFLGWDGSIPNPVTEDLVLYAQWEAISYQITNDSSNEANVDSPSSAATDETVTITVTPSAGHSIEYVAIVGDSGTYYPVIKTEGDKYQFTMPAEDVTVRATETASRLTATFRVDGSVTETKELDYGTAPTAPENPEKEGYTFQGWKAQSDKTVYDAGAPLAALTANEVYDAVFEANGYTLTYYRGAEADASDSKCVLKLADGTSVELFNNDAAGNKATYEEGSFEVGDTVTLAEPMLPGYKFLGWKDEDGYTHPAGAKYTMPAKDVQLTALWEKDEAQSVLVRFVSQGALYDAFLAYVGDTVQIPAQDPTAQGKVFGGWKSGEDTYSNIGVKNFKVVDNGAREMILEAQWTDETYTVTYNVDGTSTNEDELPYGAEIALAAAPTKEGYTFQAWKSSKDAYYLAGSAYTVTGNETFTAQWSKDTVEYTVKFLKEDGSLYDMVTVSAGSVVKAPAYGGADCQWVANGVHYDTGADIRVDGDMTLTVVPTYEKHQITATVISDGSTDNVTELPKKELAQGETEEMTIKVPQGYLLKSVTPVAADGTAVTANLIETAEGQYTYRFTMPGSELEIRVELEKIPAGTTVVKFVSDGVLYDYVIVDKGRNGSAPAAAPEKAGYTFAGWKNGTQTIGAGDTFGVAADAPQELVYTAQWTAETYTVQYAVNGGSPDQSSVSAGYGKVINLPDAPTKENYRFIGWVEESTGFVYAAGAQYTVTGSTKFTARWEVGQCVVRFQDPDTGVIYGYETVDQGSTVVAPAAPKAAGKTFLYWVNQADDTDVVHAEKMTSAISGDCVYVAVFETSTHNITVNANQCTVNPGSFSATAVGEEVSFQVTPKAEYALESVTITYHDGVNTVVRELTAEGDTYSFTMPDADVTITATAVQNTFSVFTTALDHGRIEVLTGNTAEAGSVVNFQVTTEEGYQVVLLAVYTYGTAKPVPVTAVSQDGTYAFVMPAENVKITAETMAAELSVTFLDSDNSLLGTVPVNYGDLLTTIPTARKTGYTFDHWEKMPEKTAFDPKQTAITESLTLRAVYVGDTFTVSAGRKDNVGTLNAECTVSSGNQNSSNLLQKPLKAEAGKTVYFTVAAEYDYSITEICVVSRTDSSLVVTPTLQKKTETDGTVLYTYAFEMPADDVQIDVYTAPKSFKVTVTENLPAGGTYTINGYTSTNLMVRQGEDVTILVTPAQGYTVKSVKGIYLDSLGNPAEIAGQYDAAAGTFTFKMVAKDVTVTIEYEAETYDINVSNSNKVTYRPDVDANPIGPEENLNPDYTSMGKITIDGVSDVFAGDGAHYWMVPGDGTAQVGSRVAFRVESYTGYELSDLRVTYADGEKSCTVTEKNGMYYFDMPADHVTITAQFREVSNEIIKDPGAETHGDVLIQGLQDFRVSAQYKEEVTVQVQPDPGYQVSRIYYELTDGTCMDFDNASYTADTDIADGVDGNHSITFHMPATDVTLYVEYRAIDYSITDSCSNATVDYTSPKHAGDQVCFTTKAEQGYIITKVSVLTVGGTLVEVHTGSVNPLYGAEYTFTMPAEAVEIQVETEKDQYNVKYLANGTLVGQEEVAYLDTANVDSFVSAVNSGKPGYHFVGWTSDDVKTPVKDPSRNNDDFVVVTDTIIHAVYEKDQIRVHFLPAQNGTVTETSTGSKAEYTLDTTHFGDTVQFTVEPDAGYVVDQVLVTTVNGEGADTELRWTVSGSSYSFKIPATYKDSVLDPRATDITVSVTFKKASYTLREAEDSQHDGTIAINGTVTTQTSFRYDFDDEVSIAAAPKAGYYVKSITAVSADGSVKFELLGTKPEADTAAGETRTLRFRMPACDMSYRVEFEKIDYSISKSFNANQGTVTTSPDKTAQVQDTVAVTVTPKTGYVLKTLSVTYEGGTKSCVLTRTGENTYSFTMPAQAVTVKAEFTEQTYTVSLASGGEGTVTLNGYYTDNMPAAYGDTVTVNVTPAKGWELQSILVDGGKVKLNEAIQAQGGNYTFTMPNHDVDVVVTLKKTGYTLTSYAINFFESGHGKVTLDPSKIANVGDRIVITADPDDGYRVKEVVVRDHSGNSVPVSYVSGAADYTEVWSFTMPANAVDVTVVFTVQGSSYFTDVRTDHWYYDAVTFVTDRGYFNGVSKELFAPYMNMNRAMFVTVLGRISKVDPSQYQKKAFSDVSVDTYYGPYVAWAAENGIVNGRSSTIFDPNASITRQEMAAIMYRYCKFLGMDMTPQNQVFMDRYTDTGDISGWAKESVAWAVGVGLIRGTSPNTIDPLDLATRAQVAQVIKNLCDKVLFR